MRLMKLPDNLNTVQWTSYIKLKFTNVLGQNKYEDNLKKSYALVFSYFYKVIQNRIDTCPTYQSTIQYNPIGLLNTIKLIFIIHR